MTVLAFTGCDLLSSLGKERSYPLQRNSIEGSKDTDLLILRSIFPEGLKETLNEQLEIASDARSRNYFRPSIYHWEFDTPAKAYGAASGIKRFPEGEGTYLTLNYEDDPSIEGRFFTMEPIDIGTKDCYRVVFTIKKKEGLSSLDKVESIYYVSADDWTAYDSWNLDNEDWETERVYYRDGKVGDRTMIATWRGNDAKGFFIDPDYDPFDPKEGTEAVFTIDIDRLYEYSHRRGHGHQDLDYYFQRFWDTRGRAGDYSSFTRTLVFPEGTDNIDDTGNAVSEQNDYYTEVGVSSYPSILDIPDGTPGRVQAGISYFKSPIAETRCVCSQPEDTLEIVNANSLYRDESGDFLMKDVKSFQHSPQSDYPYIYHHKYLYYDDEGFLVYHNDFYYYTEDDIDTLRAAGIDSFEKRTMTELSYKDGSWEGIFKIAVGGEEVSLNVALVGEYLQYRAEFNGTVYTFTPDADGNLDADLPGGGHFLGQVSDSGALKGTYTSAEGTEYTI